MRAIMPQMLELIERDIAMEFSCFIWIKPNGDPDDFWPSRHDNEVFNLLVGWLREQRAAPDRWQAGAACNSFAFMGASPVRRPRAADRFRRITMGPFVSHTIPVPFDGRIGGLLCCGRYASDAAFTAAESDHLLQLSRVFSTLFAQERSLDFGMPPFGSARLEAVVIVDRDGMPVEWSKGSEGLVRIYGGLNFNADYDCETACKQVSQAFSQLMKSPHRESGVTQISPFGMIVAHVHPGEQAKMVASTPNADQHCFIRLTLHRFAIQDIADRLKLIELSPREREVALHLAGPNSTISIAERLGLSATTINDYRKRIYRQTAVNSREELRQLLLASESRG